MRAIALSMILLMGTLSAQGQAENLKQLTLGFGAGYSFGLGDVDEYSLTPNGYHLKIENASTSGFSISSVITFRLGKLATERGSGKLLNRYKAKAHFVAEGITGSNLTQEQSEKLRDAAAASFAEKLSVNLAINLADVSNDGLAFNKLVDGGLGLGYHFNDILQAAVFVDVQRVRQLRGWVVDSYENMPIMNANNEPYTALDPADSQLFTTKTFAGVSFKIIFTLANKTTADD